MFSNTHLPVIRQPATRVTTSAFAALLLLAFAQQSNASDTDARVGPAPHWSSRIGTGQIFVTGSERQQSRAASTAPVADAPASAHWSARIGTGRAVAEARSTPVASPVAGVAAPTHWSAHIGAGQASPGMDGRKPAAERKGPPEARAIPESLGKHPAALVTENWSSRGIDPNTFIVRHPAGTLWVNASSATTESATADTAVRAIKTASVSNE